jgi:hypothetical protein
MIAGNRACPTSTQPTDPTIANQTNQHNAEALGGEQGLHTLVAEAAQQSPEQRPVDDADDLGPCGPAFGTGRWGVQRCAGRGGEGS